MGFGDEKGRVVDDEFAVEREGRRWNYHGPEWVGKVGKKDEFVSILTRMTLVLSEAEPLLGGPCQRVRGSGRETCGGPEGPGWMGDGNRQSRGRGRLRIFQWQPPGGGERRERGVYRGKGWKVKEVKPVAKVWDGELAGMAEGLARVRREEKVFILADSKAIAVVKRAGKSPPFAEVS